MKKILTILLCGVMILGITSCNDSKNITDDSHTFKGTILECSQESMIVKPNENENVLKSSDKFTIEYINNFNSCNVGDEVKITYIGGIKESYPAQVDTTNIEIIKDFDFYITKSEIDNDIRYNDYFTFNDRKIYLVGNINQFYVVDLGKTMMLKEYISDANRTMDSSIKTITDRLELKDILKDGGTTIYKSKEKDITMIVCNTMTENKNIYIGDYSIEYEQDMCK